MQGARENVACQGIGSEPVIKPGALQAFAGYGQRIGQAPELNGGRTHDPEEDDASANERSWRKFVDQFAGDGPARRPAVWNHLRLRPEHCRGIERGQISHDYPSIFTRGLAKA